jgi:hypothetical protein
LLLLLEGQAPPHGYDYVGTYDLEGRPTPQSNGRGRRITVNLYRKR